MGGYSPTPLLRFLFLFSCDASAMKRARAAQPSRASRVSSLKQQADYLSPTMPPRVHSRLSRAPSCTPSYVPYPAKDFRSVGECELVEAPTFLNQLNLPGAYVPCWKELYSLGRKHPYSDVDENDRALFLQVNAVSDDTLPTIN